MTYALAFTFLLGGLGLTVLSIYLYKKMKEEEKKGSK
jgi:preprotein translocase subunit SecG